MQRHPQIKPGDRFGRFTVVEFSHRDAGRRRHWLCICDCGTNKVVYAHHLKTGATRSCGCLRSETTSALLLKHGCTIGGKQAREYNSWQHMKKRCLDESMKRYPDWGGRGITICERWLDSFDNFLADMGRSPDKGYSIERRDNMRGYEKDNCYWGTATQQGRNKRNNRIIEFEGKAQCIAAWAEEKVMKQGTLYGRIRAGWTIERALLTPVGEKRK